MVHALWDRLQPLPLPRLVLVMLVLVLRAWARGIAAVLGLWQSSAFQFVPAPILRFLTSLLFAQQLDCVLSFQCGLCKKSHTSRFALLT